MWKDLGKRRGVLICHDCERESASYPIASPAAPELTLCEEAAKDGWGYDLGFAAMLRGHITICPACIAERKREREAEALQTGMALGVDAFNAAAGHGELTGAGDCPMCMRPMEPGHHGCAC